MTKSIKRILAVVLAVCTLLSTAGVSALAARPMMDSAVAEQPAVVDAGSKSPAVRQTTGATTVRPATADSAQLMAETPVSGTMTAAAFLDGAVDGVITLDGNVTLSEALNITEAVKIDLNTYTLSGSGNILFRNGASELTNGKVQVNIVGVLGASLKMEGVELTSGAVFALQIGSGTATPGSVEIVDCAITKTGTNHGAAIGIYSTSTLTVSGNTTITGSSFGIMGNGSVDKTTGEVPATTITLGEGVSVSANGGADTWLGEKTTGSLGIYHPQRGTLTTSANISGIYSGIEMRAGELIVNGGEIKSTAESFNCVANGDGVTTKGAAIAIAQHTTKKDISVTINNGALIGVKALNESNPQQNDPAPQVALSVTGGTFQGEVSAADAKDFISGGIFDTDVSGYCVEGFKAEQNEDGTYGVELDPASPRWVAKTSLTGEADLYYADLQAALTDAYYDGSETVTLLADIEDVATLGGQYPFLIVWQSEDPLTLDLNGHSIGGSSTQTLSVMGTTTIKNGTITNSSARGVAVVAQSSAITLENVNINSSASVALQLGAARAGYWGSAVVKDGCQINGAVAGIYVLGHEQNNAPATEPKSVLSVEGNSKVTGEIGISGNGTWDNTKIVVKDAAVTGTAVGIYHPQQGTLEIDEGASVSGPVGIQMGAGHLIVNGGSVASTHGETIATPTKEADQSDGSILDGAAISLVSRSAYGDIYAEIKGGSVTTANAENPVVRKYGFAKQDGAWQVIEEPTTSTAAISGGTFDTDVSAYCAADFKAEQNEDGTYGVVAKDYVAQVGTDKFETLQAAIDAAGAGATVELLKSVTESVTVAQGKDVALNIPEGVTLSGGTKNKVAAITNNGTLVLTGKGTVKRDDTAESPLAETYYVIDNQGTMTIEGALSVTNNSAHKNGSSLIRNAGKGVAATLNVEGGAFAQPEFIVLKNDDQGIVNISGGTFTTGSYALQNWGTATVEGGTFEGDTLTSVWSDKFTSSTTVTGGVFNGTFEVEPYTEGLNVKPEASISGGSFAAKPADDYLAEGYKALLPTTEGGKFTVAAHAEHSWEKSGESKAQNCEEKDCTTYTCSLCGETKQEFGKAGPHIMGEAQRVNEVPATCAAQGSYDLEYRCTKCNVLVRAERKQPIEKLPHSYGQPSWNWADDHTTATATFTCGNCAQGAEGHTVTANATVVPTKTQEADCLDPELTTFVATVTLGEESYTDTQANVETAPATGHHFTQFQSWGEWVTTEEGGYIRQAVVKCEACEETKNQDAVITGPVVVDATCKDPGSRTYTSTWGEGEGAQTEDKVEVIEKLTTHTPGQAVRENEQSATCFAEGSYDEVVYCTVCEERLSSTPRTIEKLPHTVVTDEAVEPTCTETGLTEGSHCSVCNEVLVDQETVAATGHTLAWAHDDDGHWQKCAKCDYAGEAQAHTWDTGVVSGGVRTYTCTVCGAERTSRVGTGGSSYRPVPTPTPTPTPNPPEEDLDDPDVPLTEKPFLFTDVAETDWHYDAVKYVFDNDLMKGTSDTVFSPNMDTDRGMIVTVLYRLEKEPEAAGTLFPDVALDQWYTDAVAWAVPAGIAKGYDNGNFGPEDKVTREQLVLFLLRYAQLKGYDVTGRGELSGFTDAQSVSDWALEAVQWAVSEGLLKGDNGRLKPQSAATRAEAAAILARFAQIKTEEN